VTRPLAVLVDQLGPYHHARLEAVAASGTTVAVEYSAVDPTYAWARVTPSGAFPIHTLFSKTEVQSEPLAKARFRLHEVLNSVDPEAVAIPGWSSRMSLLALDWCLRRQIPAVVMSESQAIDERRNSLREFVKRRIVGLYSAGLVGGAPHLSYLESLGMPSGRIFKGYDVVDNSHFAMGADAARHDEVRLRRALHLPERYFLASSRFVPKKNLLRLVEAYARYHKKGGARVWKLVLLGDGALRAEILQQRARLGLGEHLILPGFKQYKDLPSYYGLARAFVHASTVEQWGLVVNEAMAAGLPVLVSSRCGCAQDLVCEGKNGHVFDPENPVELSEQLLRMASGHVDLEAMGRASRAIIADWTPERFAQGLRAAIRAGIGQRMSRGMLISRLLIAGLALR
jgi:1,2-diacylglycerol 3-alpha-glucosyltransferase